MYSKLTIDVTATYGVVLVSLLLTLNSFYIFNLNNYMPVREVGQLDSKLIIETQGKG